MGSQMDQACFLCGLRMGQHSVPSLMCPDGTSPDGFATHPSQVFTPRPVHLWMMDPQGTTKCCLFADSTELTEDPALVTCPNCITLLCKEIIG